MPWSQRDIYLDANATTPTLPSAIEAARWTMDGEFANPSSTHCAGLRAKEMMESARQNARLVLKASRGRILFTSGATEAIQTAVLSALSAKADGDPRYAGRHLLLYGATEHKAVPESLKHWNHLLHTGCEVRAIPVDGEGRHDLAVLRELAPAALLVCTMAVNNETGVISDLDGIEGVLREQPDCLWLVDGVQALGKLPIALDRSRIDYFPLSGHKLYAPKGIGLLWVRESAPFTPLTAGGGQEGGQRSGTENMSGIAGFGAVLQELVQCGGQFCAIEALHGYRERLVGALRQAFPGIVFNMPFDRSVPTTINFSVPGFASKELLDLFDAAGIRVSSGSACSSGKAARSHVLDAMGLPCWRSESAVRLSFGRVWTDADCQRAAERILEAGHALRNACLMTESASQRDDFDGVIQFKHDGACTWLIVARAAAKVVIIDPVSELCDRIERYVRCQGLKVDAVLDTHSHADHESARELLLKDFGGQGPDPAVAVDALGWPQAAGSVDFGQYQLRRMALPGHTADSVGYVLARRTADGAWQTRQVFVGDTVLIGGIGRTNFPSSSAPEIYRSIRRLGAEFGHHMLLCPAHDYRHDFATTLAAEAAINPLLAHTLAELPDGEASFVSAKAQVDAELDDSQGQVLMCGSLRCSSEPDPAGLEFNSQSLRDYLAAHPEARMVDVREAYERAMGAAIEPELHVAADSVPLSRLSQNLVDWLAGEARPLIFFCRSGNRSLLAAKCLRRLGHTQAYHLRGGLALFR